MPTIIREEGYRFFFFSNEHEPIHIHVEKGEKYAKIDVTTSEIIESYMFTSKELKKIMNIVKANQEKIMEAWNEYFRKG